MDDVPNLKYCKKCREWRAIEQFRREPRMSDGRRGDCNVCRNARRRSRYDPAKARVVNKRNSWYARAWRYGVSEEDLLAMLEAQGGVCAICPKQMSKPCVDHDHATGQVRGLLCHGCNTMLGLAGDDPERLNAAIAYLVSSLVC